MKKQIQKRGQAIKNNLNIPLFAPNTILEGENDNFYLSYTLVSQVTGVLPLHWY